MNRDFEVDPESGTCMNQAGVSWPRDWLDQAITWVFFKMGEIQEHI